MTWKGGAWDLCAVAIRLRHACAAKPGRIRVRGRTGTRPPPCHVVPPVPTDEERCWCHETRQIRGDEGRPPGSKTSPGGRLKGILPRPYGRGAAFLVIRIHWVSVRLERHQRE